MSLLVPGATLPPAQGLRSSRVRSSAVTALPSLRPLSAPGYSGYLFNQPLADQPSADGHAGTDEATIRVSRDAVNCLPFSCDSGRPVSAPVQQQQAGATGYNQLPADVLLECPGVNAGSLVCTSRATPREGMGTQLAAEFMREAASLHSEAVFPGMPLVPVRQASACAPGGRTQLLFVAASGVPAGADAEPPAVLTAGISARGQLMRNGALVGAERQPNSLSSTAPTFMDVELLRVHILQPSVCGPGAGPCPTRGLTSCAGAPSALYLGKAGFCLSDGQGKRERGSVLERPPAGPKRSAVGVPPARAMSTEPDDDEDSDDGSSRADRVQGTGGATAAAGYIDEREAKKQLRKEKNRASAAASRARREAYTASLEEEVRVLDCQLLCCTLLVQAWKY